MSPIPLLRRLSSLAAAVRYAETTTWTQAPLTHIRPASPDGTLFHISVDVSDFPNLAASHTAAGQYIQLRLPGDFSRPSFLSIASPPSLAAAQGIFEFLVRRVPGSAAEMICGLRGGDLVEVSDVMGRGFQVDRISPPDAVAAVLIFATGTGISPIRSLIESGFSASKRSDVRLYYGARNLHWIAYQDRFKEWESTGIRIIPVLSRADDRWKGECGYVQAAFCRARQILKPLSTGAVLCGHKQMTEALSLALAGDGISKERILTNF